MYKAASRANEAGRQRINGRAAAEVRQTPLKRSQSAQSGLEVYNLDGHTQKNTHITRVQ